MDALLAFLELDPAQAPALLALPPRFPLRVPRAFAERMRKGDWQDPLLRQVLPLRAEAGEVPGFVPDPVGDGAAEQSPGLLRKYQGRALLILTGVCAVHCRYCFRREYPYADAPAAREEWESVYAGLAGDPTVEEIIFSGGDPLSISDAKLRWHFELALSIPHLRRIRIHTRLPVVLPSRVDESFLALIAEMSGRRPLFLVIHANHAREIDSEVEAKLRALRTAGAILLNQSVLLRGVNDDAQALAELSERLLDSGVLPYYLHQLDRVRGAHEFEVPEEEGLALMEELRLRLPGYGLPRYVREIAGEASKLEVAAIPLPAEPPL